MSRKRHVPLRVGVLQSRVASKIKHEVAPERGIGTNVWAQGIMGGRTQWHAIARGVVLGGLSAAAGNRKFDERLIDRVGD